MQSISQYVHVGSSTPLLAAKCTSFVRVEQTLCYGVVRTITKAAIVISESGTPLGGLAKSWCIAI